MQRKGTTMEDKERKDNDFFRSQLMLLDYLLSEGFEVTWREGTGMTSAGFCWLLPNGSMAGMTETLADVPPLVVNYLTGDG